MTAAALRHLIVHLGETAEWLRSEGHDDLAEGLMWDGLSLQAIADREAAEEAAAQPTLPL